MTRRLLTPAFLVAALLALPVQAADDDPNVAATDTRQALMAVVGWSLQPIVAMSTGRQDFDAERISCAMLRS